MKILQIMRNAVLSNALAFAAVFALATFALVTVASEAAAQKRVTVMSLLQPIDNPWVANNVRFQEEVAEALDIDLSVVSDRGTDESNVAAMRTMIAAAPDGILFDPISEAAGRQDARLLEEAKMIGVTQDRLVVPHISEYQGEYLKAQVTQDNYEWGYRTMQNLVDSGATKLLIIMPPHGILTLEQLWAGSKDYLKDHPEVQIVEESWSAPQTRQTAVQVMQRFLVKYTPGEDFDGVLGIGSTMALGAQYVLEQEGVHEKVKVMTADDDADVMKALQTNRLVTTLGAHWMNGGFGLIVLYDILNGHMPLDPQPQFHLIQIDAETADAYAARFLWGEESPFTPEEIRSLSLTYNPDANLPDFMANLWQRWFTESRGF